MADKVKVAKGGKEKAKPKGAAAEGGKGGVALSGSDIQIARMLVRALWAQETIAANPEMAAADRAAQWKEVRQARNDAELKKIRRALLTLKRSGVVMTLSEKAAKTAETTEVDAEADVED